MAGKNNPKTGGRKRGTPNRLTAKSRRRLTRQLEPALRILFRRLGDEKSWDTDFKACLTATMDSLRFLVPAFKATEADSPVATAAAPAEQAQPQSVTAEDILRAFRSSRIVKPIVATAVPSLPEPVRDPEMTPTLPTRQSEALRHQGIPVDGGNARLIPAAKVAQREPHPDPDLPSPAIDVSDSYAQYRQPTGSLTSVEAACQFVDQHEPDFARVSASADEQLPASLQRRRYGR